MGSDHRAIETTFQTGARPTPSPTPRFVFRAAPWADINRELKGLETEIVDPTSCSELDAAVGQLTSRVSLVIGQLVPVARPSPYSKRWWTLELTALRDTYTWARNRCTRARRYGFTLPELEDTASHLRRQYHQAIRDTKRRYWREFLNNTDNIWKAAQYLEPGGRSIGTVPALRSSNRTIDDDQGKAQALPETFFPPLPAIQGDSAGEEPQLEALPMEEISAHEIGIGFIMGVPSGAMSTLEYFS